MRAAQSTGAPDVAIASAELCGHSHRFARNDGRKNPSPNRHLPPSGRCTAVVSPSAARGRRRDVNWILGIGLLSEVAVLLADRDSAATLYDLLKPYASLVVGTPHAFHSGVAARNLGILACALSRPTEAIAHLEHAVAANERMGAHPWTAHAKADHAHALRARDAPGDRQRADDLLREALATYETLGMPWSGRRVSATLDLRART